LSTMGSSDLCRWWRWGWDPSAELAVLSLP